jgi:hypothetical protein
MMLLQRVWMRHLWSMNIPMSFLMICWGWHPDRVIVFKIELQLGTAPVYERLDPIVPNELVEMKTQLQELLDVGYIRPSYLQWGCPAPIVNKKDKTLCMCIDY